MSRMRCLRSLCAVLLTVMLLGVQTVSAEWFYLTAPATETRSLDVRLGEFLYESEEVLPEDPAVAEAHQTLVEALLNNFWGGLNSPFNTLENFLNVSSAIYGGERLLGSILGYIMRNSTENLNFVIMRDPDNANRVYAFTFSKTELEGATAGLDYITTYATVFELQNQTWVNVGSQSGYAQAIRHSEGFKTVDPATWKVDLD